MRIYISKNNQQLGPFEDSQVLESLAAGKFSPDDFAIQEGEMEWVSLRDMFPNAASPFSANQQILTNLSR